MSQTVDTVVICPTDFMICLEIMKGASQAPPSRYPWSFENKLEIGKRRKYT
jgi:hypothetical protein